jgi:hypothetical protein
MVEAADLQTGLVPHREAQGTERALHAPGAKPVFGLGDERLEHRLVGRFHHAPVAGPRPHPLRGGLGEREMVDMGRNPADGAAIALGKENCASPWPNHGFLPGVMRP